MIIRVLVARARNGVIGANGDMPWHLPGDLKRFKDKTMGSALIMGRKTFESIGRPLPGRRNIVITRNSDWSAEGAEVVSSPEAALALCQDCERISIIGGGEIYRLMMPYVHEVFLTEVHGEPSGDTTFDALDPNQWQETGREELETHNYVDFRRIGEPKLAPRRLN